MQIQTRAKATSSDTSATIMQTLLRQRGITAEAADGFLHPTLPPLSSLITSLHLNISALKSVKDIVTQGIRDNKNFCVYGDYDADGITATAIMWQTLAGMGARALPFIPSRSKHGYGLSARSVEELLSGSIFQDSKFPGFVPDIIITVDTGIVANQEVAQLRASGKIVIVTDHHQPGKILLGCDALVHTQDTSGAGISWIVARYLSGDSQQTLRRIDLATIGIVADQVPVTGVNRSIIYQGLKAIEQTNLVGLYSILELSGIAGKTLATYDINYVLAPRINAVGRIDNATDALRLLCTNNKTQAQKLSSSMELLNKDRQELTATAVEDALKHIDDHKITIVASRDYHHGIIGLIASKLAEHAHKPAVAMSIDGDLVKGSARSVTGVNVTNLLRRQSHLLLGVGGHEQAAGFSLSKDNLDEFVVKLTQDADTNIGDELLVDTVVVDLELPLTQVSLELAEELKALEPFGIGNPKPRFVSHNLVVIDDKKMGIDGKHHKLTVSSGSHQFTILWFNGQSVSGSIKSLVYTIDINKWQNKKELQLVASYVEV